MSAKPAVKRGAAVDEESSQYLTFVLGGETYGLDILRVQEIRAWSAVTKIPHAPAHLLGVLNLRGSIVPVVDLRIRLALERAEYSSVTVIIVVSVTSATGHRDLGVVVDGVSDVMDVVTSEVKAPPEMGGIIATDYVKGLVPMQDRMLVLLDIERLIGSDLTLFAPNARAQSAAKST